MQAAGNDFILVDDPRAAWSQADAGLIRRLCARHTGIGSEGVILIQPSAQADFRMRFFNPDGAEAEMCGNGARCAARLAHDLGRAPATMRMATRAGLVQAAIVGEEVRLALTQPRAWRLQHSLRVRGRQLLVHFVNTGVPHAVLESRALTRLNVELWGRALRYHQHFAPHGTNVNFMTITGRHALRLRTYERGVEAETAACGTGSAAAALIAARLGRLQPPVQVTCASGDVLEVDFRLTAKGARAVTLRGPAVYVFKGCYGSRPAAARQR